MKKSGIRSSGKNYGKLEREKVAMRLVNVKAIV